MVKEMTVCYWVGMSLLTGPFVPKVGIGSTGLCVAQYLTLPFISKRDRLRRTPMTLHVVTS